MGKSQRDKGTRGEQEVARFYRDRGHPAARVPNSGGLDTKGDVVGVDGIHIEAKFKERMDIWACLQQTEEEAPAGTIPALHFRRSRVGWFVAVPMEDFADLLEEAGR